MKLKPVARRGDRIHPTAVLGSEVELGPDVEVGPFCVLDGRVSMGARSRLIAHVTILGDTKIGRDNVFHPNTVIGNEPQDLNYRGDPRAVRIGNGNVFREGCTVHRGCQAGEVTILGDGNLLMANSHVGHDCRIGSNVILVNGALLGGWVEVGDRAIISGNCAVHQFCRIGRLSMMRGLSRTSRDIPPFCIVDTDHYVRAVNALGLKRAGMSNGQIASLRQAFRILFRETDNLKLGVEKLVAEGPKSAEITELVQFIRASKRGVASLVPEDREGAEEE